MTSHPGKKKNREKDVVFQRRYQDFIYPIYSGVVYKQGKYLGKWKPRWFVVEDDKLYYFQADKEHRPIGDMLGYFVLSKCAAKAVDPSSKKHFAFKLIEHPSRSCLLCTDDLKQKMVWIDVITNASTLMARRRKAILTFQAKVRAKRQRREYLQQVAAAIVLQTHIRRITEIAARKRRLRCIIKVQATWRMYKAKKRYKTSMKLVFCAQRACRRWIAKIRLKREVKRKQIISEILATERSYVNNLLTLLDVFMHPMKTAEVVPTKDITTIFSTIEDIHFVNNTFCLALEERFAVWNVNTPVGDIFIKSVSAFLDHYTPYITNFDESLKLLKKRNTANEGFSNFVQSAQKNPRTKAIDLSGFLIQPVQRLPRYEMLLKELLKVTFKHHVDYPNLSEAMKKIKDTTLAINEHKRKADTGAVTNNLKKELVGKLVKEYSFANTKLVASGPVIHSSGDFMHLLSDTIMISRMKKGEKHVKDIIDLKTCMLTFGENEKSETKSCLKIISSKNKKEHTLEFATTAEFDSWKKHISSVLAALEERKKALMASRSTLQNSSSKGMLSSSGGAMTASPSSSAVLAGMFVPSSPSTSSTNLSLSSSPSLPSSPLSLSSSFSSPMPSSTPPGSTVS